MNLLTLLLTSYAVYLNLYITIIILNIIHHPEFDENTAFCRLDSVSESSFLNKRQNDG
jgi:hypothetical protein